MSNSPKNFSVRGFLKLTRSWNLIIIILAQYFTAVFLLNHERTWVEVFTDPKLFLLSLSTALIAGAGYIINDYYDVKIDYINKPERVVVGRVLKRRVVMAMHITLSTMGVLIGAYLSLKIAAIHLLAVLLLWLYSNQLKRMPFIGNFSVALMTGFAIYIVSILYYQHHHLVLIYAIFAFFFTLVREVIKDMEDLKGDLTFGCKTLPIVWGIRNTKWFVYGLLITFLITVILILTINVGFLNNNFIFLLALPVVLIAIFLYRADTIGQFRRLSNYCKLIMLLGILSMAMF